MTKEQLWEQQEHTWNVNNVFPLARTAWMAGFETAMARTCEWVRKDDDVHGITYTTSCDRERAFNDATFQEYEVDWCCGCGGRVKEAK